MSVLHISVKLGHQHGTAVVPDYPICCYVLPDDGMMALPGRRMELHMKLYVSSPQHIACCACLRCTAANTTVVIVFGYSF